MSNQKKRDFSSYDAMTTEALEEILRLDAEAPLDREQDTELLFYIMSVLAERKRADGHPRKTAAQAWKEFLEHYFPCEETLADEPAAASPKKRRPARWLRHLAAAAAAFAVVVCAAFTADAFGFNILNIVGKWTEDMFYFAPIDQTEPNTPTCDDPTAYTELQKLLLRSGVDPNLAPTWIPDGFELTEFNYDPMVGQTGVVAYYYNGDRTILVSITSFLPEAPARIERSEGSIEVIQRDGVKYYLFTNLDCMCAAWIKDTWECTIGGHVTVEELKKMINSIPKG